jgi:hypothetical protein
MELARRIANWLLPYILEDINQTIEPIAYGHTITRELVEALANDLGREVTFDLQTGEVTVHKTEVQK